MRPLITITTALVASLVSLSSWANNGLTGYTGKPNINAPQGATCNQCHAGGTAPQVSITGPTTLAAGQSAEFTLVVTTAQSRASGAIAATDGVVLTPVANLRDSFGEMVPNAPVVVSGGQASFRFNVKAPTTGTTLRLWAVGLAANNANGPNGDLATQTTSDVAITGGGPSGQPDAGGSSSGGAADAGDLTDADGGASSSGGTGESPGTDSTPNEENPAGDNSAAGPPTRSRPLQDQPGGLSCSSSSASGGSGAALAAFGVIAAMGAARRRRRRCA